jgi:acyl-CoA synthetase (NDP forming)
MFAVASVLASQPVPRGRRVAILTNGGGPGILCADACAAEGLEIAPLSPDTQASLRKVVPSEASVTNPVDLIASATAEQYRSAIEIVGQDPAVDAIVVLFVPPLVTQPEAVARAVVEAATTLGGAKPVLSVFLQSADLPEQLRGPRLTIPSFAFPEDAAIALAKVARYGEWLARPEEPPAEFADVRREEAAAIIATAAANGGGWLAPRELWRLLSCYGLPMVEQAVVATPEEAANAAASVGSPVALKAVGPAVVHKKELGAVRVNLAAGEVLAEARAMTERLARAGTPAAGFVVQPMAIGGAEMVVGVVHDPQFGPVVACGAGGTLVELLKDVSVRLTPLSRRDGGEMVRGLRTYPLLTGYRGSAPLDSAALIEVILRIAAMAEDLPRIAELDLNPVMVNSAGVTVVDARLRVAPVDTDKA